MDLDHLSEPRQEPARDFYREESSLFVEQHFEEEASPHPSDSSSSSSSYPPEIQDVPGNNLPVQVEIVDLTVNQDDSSDEEDNTEAWPEDEQVGREEGDPEESDDEIDEGEQSDEEEGAEQEKEVNVRLAQAQGSKTCIECSLRVKKIRKLQRRLNVKVQVIRGKDATIRRLREELRRLQSGDDNPLDNAGQRQTWQASLRSFMAESTHEEGAYENIWRQSNKAENMSVRLDCIHPNIQLVPPPHSNLDIESIDDGSSHHDLPNVSSPPQLQKFERFNELPNSVQLRVFRHLLKMNGSLIHVFSRLDPYNPTEPGPSKSGLYPKFFISSVRNGKDLVSLTNDTTDPATLLRPLLTCKRWCFYLCHVFYGENTFAFSSFGELQRFANGIGAARVQRLQHIELAWQGGVQQCRFDKTPGKYQNMRTLPLFWFCEAVKLRTLVIFISETGKGVMRRRHETADCKTDMKVQTAGQPNATLTRSMRSLQGLDFILSLRGMDWCKWYDSEKMARTGQRSQSFLRDQSFVLDVNRSVCMAKVPMRARKARLHRLNRLFATGGWNPGVEDFQAVQDIYNENRLFGPILNDLDIDCGKGTPKPSSDSSDSSENSDDSESDSSSSTGSDEYNGGLPTPPFSVGSNARSHRATAPAPESSRDSSDSDDEGSSHKENKRWYKAGANWQEDDQMNIRIQRIRQYIQTQSIGLHGPVSSARQQVFVNIPSRPNSESEEEEKYNKDEYENYLLDTPHPVQRLSREPSNIIGLTAPDAHDRRQNTPGMFVTPGSEELDSNSEMGQDTSVYIDLTLDDSSNEDDNIIDRQEEVKPEEKEEVGLADQQHDVQNLGQRDPSHLNMLADNLNLFDGHDPAAREPFPLPRGSKRPRASPVDSDPAEDRKRQMRLLRYGPWAGWQWSRGTHNE